MPHLLSPNIDYMGSYHRAAQRHGAEGPQSSGVAISDLSFMDRCGLGASGFGLRGQVHLLVGVWGLGFRDWGFMGRWMCVPGCVWGGCRI